MRTTALRSTIALCGAPARALLVRCLYFARYALLARRLRGRVRARAVHGAAPHAAIPHNGARARACPPLRLRLGVHAADHLAFFFIVLCQPSGISCKPSCARRVNAGTFRPIACATAPAPPRTCRASTCGALDAGAREHGGNAGTSGKKRHSLEVFLGGAILEQQADRALVPGPSRS